MLRRNMFLIGLLLVLGLWSTSIWAEPVSGIRAIVHDSVITTLDVEKNAAAAIDAARRQFRNDRDGFYKTLNKLMNDSLEELIQRKLILHDFESSGYNLPESIIEQNIQEIIRSDYGDRQTLIKTLQARGINYEEYRKEMRDRIIVRALRSKNVSSEIIISPSKIEKYYRDHEQDYKVEDQVKLRMIVITNAPGESETAQKLAEEIQSQLREGADFGQLASVYSQGFQRAQNGDLGWVDRKFLIKELADVAFSLKPGERSPVIKLPLACYILQVEDVKPAHIRPLSEVREEIEKNLTLQEESRLAKQYIARLRKKTFVRYF